MQVVGSFAVQDETTDAITEALTYLKQWNPLWQPQCFMVDNCEEEISSVNTLFPCEYLLSGIIVKDMQ